MTEIAEKLSPNISAISALSAGQKDGHPEGDRTKVDEQVATYDLKGKLMQSITDCEIVAGQKDFFPRIPRISA